MPLQAWQYRSGIDAWPQIKILNFSHTHNQISVANHGGISFICRRTVLQMKNKRVFIDVLPSPKGVALAIMEACGRDDATMDSVDSVIQTNPALAARLFQLANSGHAGRPEVPSRRRSCASPFRLSVSWH